MTQKKPKRNFLKNEEINKTRAIKVKWVLFVGFLIALLVLLFVVFQRTLDPEQIKNSILSFGILAPIIFIILYSISLFIPMLSPVMSIVGGLAFGPFYGTLLVLLIATIASSLPLLLSRKLGRKWVLKKIKGTKYEKYQEKINKNSFLYIFYLRLIPIVPYEIQNYLAGLTKIRLPKFMLATFLGILPVTFSLVLLGDSITDLSSPKIYIALLLIIITILIPIIISKIKKTPFGK